MNKRKIKQPPPIARHPLYSRAIQELNERILENSESNDLEKIDLLRLIVFGEVDGIPVSETKNT